MDLTFPPILIFLIVVLAVYALYQLKVIPAISDKIADFILRTSSMYPIPREDVYSALWRILRFNWYSVLTLFLLWYILFKLDVGADTIESYLNNLDGFKWDGQLYSLLMLFSSIFILSLSIWLIPFFLYSEQRQHEVSIRIPSFYAATKLLALLAMVPFYLMANVFAKHAHPKFWNSDWKLLVLDVIVIGCLALTNYAITYFSKTNWANRFLGLAANSIQKRYAQIIISIYFFELIISLFFVFLFGLDLNTSAIVSTFIFLSSGLTFRILFYTDESRADDPAPESKYLTIEEWFSSLFTHENKQESKYVFKALVIITLLWNGYYFLIPSLMETNTLYILFAFFCVVIIYADFLRNYYQNGDRARKIVVITIFAIAFAVPTLSPKEQFRIPLVKFPLTKGKKVSPKPPLEAVLKERLASIDSTGRGGPVYIICGMGGGSRAGFITSSILNKIDEIYPNIYHRTICYSTISGSSPGLYHYLKTRDASGEVRKNALEKIYDRNYNSSGLYGLLIGDPLDALFGGILSAARGPMLDTVPPSGYFDRNLRIRMEYESAMIKAIYDKNTANASEIGLKRYFANSTNLNKGTVDGFQEFFHRAGSHAPIHLINSFEVNSGRRTVLSPYPVRDTLMFANCILPLQDKRFDCDVLDKDITYRDATNLSELFPFVSAVSTIGQSPFQFADGGNFENYGLATGMDIANFLVDRKLIDKSRIRIILIKNSAQNASTPTTKGQLLAPLIGAVNSPFTGHANHFLIECAKMYGKNFRVILFDSGKKDFEVPLTRALTRGQINKMRTAVEYAGKTITTRLPSSGDSRYLK